MSNIIIVEGLEVNLDEHPKPKRAVRMVRIGPFPVTPDFRDMIEAIVSENGGSISQNCIRLMEDGLKYRGLPVERQRRKIRREYGGE